MGAFPAHKELPYRVRFELRLWRTERRCTREQGSARLRGERKKTARGCVETEESAWDAWALEDSLAEPPTATDVLVVHQDLVVQSRSHKKMAIGPKGKTLRLMQAAAEADMAKHFGMPVELRLWVREGSKQRG